MHKHLQLLLLLCSRPRLWFFHAELPTWQSKTIPIRGRSRTEPQEGCETQPPQGAFGCVGKGLETCLWKKTLLPLLGAGLGAVQRCRSAL